MLPSIEDSGRDDLAGGEAGSWRAALNPDGYCALCRQAICGHTDAEYIGAGASVATGEGPATVGLRPAAIGQSLLDPLKGCADPNARASAPGSLSFHPCGDTDA